MMWYKGKPAGTFYWEDWADEEAQEEAAKKHAESCIQDVEDMSEKAIEAMAEQLEARGGMAAAKARYKKALEEEGERLSKENASLVEWAEETQAKLNRVKMLAKLGYSPRVCRSALSDLEAAMWAFRSALPEEERDRLEWLEANQEVAS